MRHVEGESVSDQIEALREKERLVREEEYSKQRADSEQVWQPASPTKHAGMYHAEWAARSAAA